MGGGPRPRGAGLMVEVRLGYRLEAPGAPPSDPAWDKGPGDNRPAFDEILRRIEVSHQ